MAQRASFWTDPLWPAGHLPLEAGERLAGKAGREPSRFSPLEGEMAFRPEGVVDDFAEIASC